MRTRSVAILFLLAGCAGQPSDPADSVGESEEAVTRQLVAGSKLTDPATAVHFLQPVGNAAEKSGTDATLANFLTVEVCTVATSSCKVLDTLDAAWDGKRYNTSWKQPAGGTYRFTILVAGRRITSTDVSNNGKKDWPIKLQIDNHPVIRARVLADQLLSAKDFTAKLKTEFALVSQDAAQLLFDEKYDATAAAGALKASYASTSTDAAKLLQVVGYPLKDIAKALQATFALSNADVAKTLQGLPGVTLGDVAKAIRDGLSLSNSAVAAALAVNNPLAQVASALRDGLGLPIGGVASALQGAGVNANDIAKALQTGVGGNPKDIANSLLGAGFTPQQILTALAGAGVNARDGVNALKNSSGAYTAAQIAGFNKSTGAYLLGALTDAFSVDFSLLGPGIAMVFKGANYGVDQIAGGLRTGLNATNDLIATSLDAAAFPVDQIVVGLRSLGIDASIVASTLHNALHLTNDAIAAGMHFAGYELDLIVESLHFGLNLTNDAIALALKTTQLFHAGSIAEALQIGLQLTNEAVALAMRGASFAVDEVAFALYGGINLTKEEIAVALRGANYTIDQIALGLKNGLGLDATPIAEALKNGLAAGADLVFLGLDACKFSIDTMVFVLHGTMNIANDLLVSLLSGRFGPDTICKALSDVLGLTNAVIHNLLEFAGYSAHVIAGAFATGLQMPLDTFVSLAHSLGWNIDSVNLSTVFNAGADEVVVALKAAGYACDEVTKILQDGLQITSDAAMAALKGAGYALDEIRGAFKSVLNLGDEAIANMAQAAGFAADSIANLFGDAWSKTSDVLDDIADGFCDIFC